MFDNFISLGYKCKVAASMQKYGLRSFSGVFDWCCSELKGIIKVMDNDFLDLLHKEDLVMMENPLKFKNIKYDIIFEHDIKTSFDEEYEQICIKYMRRIERFRAKVKNNTCFIRWVMNQNEIAYIMKNLEYINYVIKNKNPNNKIVYLIEESLSVPSSDIDYYKIKDDIHIVKYRDVEDLRSLFDTNNEFINFCIDNFDKSIRYNNIIYYLETRLERAENKLIRADSNYQLLLKLENANFDKINLPNNVIIYGGGGIGKILYNKIKYKCSIICFIDESIDKGMYDNIPIIRIKDLVNINNIDTIIITPIYDYDKISNCIRKVINDIGTIVSLKELL